MEIKSFITKEGKRADAKPDKSLRHTPGHMDFLLFAVVLGISLFGLVMVFSASYYNGQVVYDDPFHHMPNQIMCFVIGLIIMLVIANLGNYHWLKKASPFLYLAALILLVITIFFGEEKNGATRWLSIGSLSFQPSELAKYALMVFMATFMAANPNRMKHFFKGVVPMLVAVLLVCGLIILQPNLSMVVIIGIMALAMMFIGGIKWSAILGLAATAFVAVVVLAFTKGYRVERMLAFFDPWQDPLDTGYHTIQSLYALASGGLFGTGLNFSRQKLLFLKYSESDYIFAIIGEELGFIGAILLIAAYCFVIYRGIRIAMRCRDRFGSLLAAGITVVLAVQIMINIGVTCGVVPSTGQTLPFISLGGTSLIICMAAIGILLNVSKNTE